jgi:hypothetical protein
VSDHRTHSSAWWGSDLSSEARARAAAMLPALQRDLAHAVRRRRAAARALAGGATVALIATAATLSLRARPVQFTPVAPPVAQTPSPITGPTIEVVRSLDAPLIEVVRKVDAGALAAITVAPTVDLASIRVTDHELLDLLNAIGRPTGLVRAQGRVWLTAAVTDDELARQRGL